MRRAFGTPIGDYLPAFGLALVTALYLAAAYRYPPDAREIPADVAWTMLGLIALDLVSRTHTGLGRALMRWFNPAADREDAEAKPHYTAGRQIIAVLWLMGFAAALNLIGILYAVPLYVLAFTRLRGGRTWRASIAVACGTTLFLWLLFAFLLRLELYPGALIGGR